MATEFENKGIQFVGPGVSKLQCRENIDYQKVPCSDFEMILPGSLIPYFTHAYVFTAQIIWKLGVVYVVRYEF